MKVIHITDLHIGPDNCTANCAQIVKWIVAHRDPATELVVVSGDLADKTDQLPIALDTLKPLRDRGFEILPAPGNHDYSNDNGFSVYWKHAQTFDRSVFNVQEQTYPIVTTRGDVTFIALDSIREVFFWDEDTPDPYADNGRRNEPKPSAQGLHGYLGVVGRNKLEAILKGLPANQKVVVFLHHDPGSNRPTMELIDRVPFKALLHKYKVETLLCGHTHTYGFATDEAAALDLNGGSSGGKDMAPSPVRIYDMETGNIEEIRNFAVA